MTFEVGKTYKTCDGREAIIYAIHEGQIYPVHGAFRAEDGHFMTCEWTADGCYTSNGTGRLDLMPPEPKIETPDLDQIMRWYHGKDGGGSGFPRVAREVVKWECARRSTEPTEEMLEECWAIWFPSVGWMRASGDSKTEFRATIRKALEMQAGRP